MPLSNSKGGESQVNAFFTAFITPSQHQIGQWILDDLRGLIATIAEASTVLH